ncbi:large conductance mechanosensitive channel protein MscL [Candidatus Clostridium stratigraminis]|uniref:Large-conductance mechanosensitive channel n=1 Tax=Candidatus Clostridium stratigraminis TaxID=3381661 RepID=A0ABW8T778_9CLOT
MWKEFKEFAMKGNVVDLAVGVIIGGAFGKIVSSLVSDIIMPVIGLILGNIDYTNLFLPLDGGHYKTLEAAKGAGAATLNYGVFLNNVIDFLIIAFSIFMVIKLINRFAKKKEEESEPSNTKLCKYCYSTVHVDATRCPHCTSVLE